MTESSTILPSFDTYDAFKFLENHLCDFQMIGFLTDNTELITIHRYIKNQGHVTTTIVCCKMIDGTKWLIVFSYDFIYATIKLSQVLEFPPMEYVVKDEIDPKCNLKFLGYEEFSCQFFEFQGGSCDIAFNCEHVKYGHYEIILSEFKKNKLDKKLYTFYFANVCLMVLMISLVFDFLENIVIWFNE